MSEAGTNSNKFNITYSYVNEKYLIQALAIQNSISGIIGFCSSLIGGGVLAYIQKNNNMIFGIPIYGQQILSLISFVIVICAIVYDRLVVERQDIIVQ